MFDWLWPIACLGCGEIGRHKWCVDCAPGTPLCPPVESFGISRAFAVERYGRPVGQALGRAKRDADRVRALDLAQLYAAQMAPVLRRARPDALVPAPSTRSTRASRGFSMASLLAQSLSKRTGVPVVHALRSTATTRLATLNRKGRKQALRGRVRALRDVPGRVILVDDVMTTGATAEASAVELLGGRTDEVLLATLCVVARPRRPRISARS